MGNKYIGQIIGTREIIRDYCTDEDWINSGMTKPSNHDSLRKYVLGKCLNCGSIKPVNIASLKRHPPKKCSFCSNISHHSTIRSNKSTFTRYENYAVINIEFNNKIYTAYIDAEDYDKCVTRDWRIALKRNNPYVITGSKNRGKNNMIYLHQFVFGTAPKGYEIDHRDHNSLNNRKSNLQYLTKSDNKRKQRCRIDSQIGIRGVSFDKKAKRYIVDFSFDHNRFYFKQWKTLEEACWCRFCAEDFFGLDTAKLNPLFKQYDTLNDTLKKAIKEYVRSIIEK